jgi:hypothetical protein
MPLGAALLLLAAAADGWQTESFTCEDRDSDCSAQQCCQRGVLLEKRDPSGSEVREVRASGTIDAPPSAVFALVTDFERQKGFAYIEDVRVLERGEDEVVFWSMGNFPIISRRDWVLRARMVRDAAGSFRVRWEVTDFVGAPPPALGVVRLRVNTGEWLLEPLDGARRTRAQYFMSTDPGGHVPAWLANLVVASTLPKVFRAIRGEAEKSRHQ